MGLHVAQMTSAQAEMRELLRCGHRQCGAHPAAWTATASAPGCHADLVLLQARDPVEAIRLRAQRLWVMRRGRIVSRMPAASAQLDLPGRPARIDWTHRAVGNDPPVESFSI